MKTTGLINQLIIDERIAFFGIVIALALGVAELRAANSPPTLINYQGYLVDAAGNPLGSKEDANNKRVSDPTNYNVRFKIYNSQTSQEDDAMKWTETLVVTVDNGYFNVYLGESSAITGDVFNGDDADVRFVGITVSTDTNFDDESEIAPRLRLLSSPYSMLAARAVTADSLSSGVNSILTVSDAGTTAAGTLTVSGATSLNGGATAGNLTVNGATSLEDQTIAKKDLSVVGKATAGSLAVTANATTQSLNVEETATLKNTTTETFSVTGNNITLSGTSPTINFDDTDNKNFYIHANNDALYFMQGEGDRSWDSNRPITIYQGNKVGINKVAPAHALDVAGNVQAASFGGGTANLGNIISSGAISAVNSVDTKSSFVVYRGGAGKYATFSRDVGTLYLSLNSSYHTTVSRVAGYDGDSNWDFWSDRRLKKDIVDVEPILGKLLDVRVRRYKWKGARDPNKSEIGVIGQELRGVFPDLIGKMYNEELKDDMLSVGYTSFGILAVRGVQELKQEKDNEIRSLRQENQELKNEIKVLTDRLADSAKIRDQRIAKLEGIVSQLAD